MLRDTSRRVFLVLSVVVTSIATAAAQTAGCEVPDGMKKEQKLPCIRAGNILLDQPTLTAEQLTNGPQFDSAQPEKSRFAYFTDADTIHCYFRPHYAFVKVPGDSMKFQCWHLTEDGGFYSPKGEVLNVGDVKVVVKTDKSGEKEASLYPRDDAKNEHEIKADRVKVKYLKPPYPDHDPRFNEVFTAVAATRFMWVLGFPADNVYPAGSASCIGCTADPFGKKLSDNKASTKDPPDVFKVVNVERELAWDVERYGQVLFRRRVDAQAKSGIRRLPTRPRAHPLPQCSPPAEPTGLRGVGAGSSGPLQGLSPASDLCS